MRLNGIFGAALLAGACSASLVTAASAADMAPFYAPSEGYAAPEQPLEFGAGWYLRGDASANFADELKLDLAVGQDSFQTKKSDIGYGFGGGVGYKLNSFLRFDITGDYLSPYDDRIDAACAVLCDTNVKTTIWRWDGLANAYVDLGTWSGITPYVGAGVGVSGTHQRISGTVFGQGVTLADLDPVGGKALEDKLRRTDYEFAWAAMAGFSYSVTPHMLLDIGYRYLDLGRTTVPITASTTYNRDMTAHQARVGIRYIID